MTLATAAIERVLELLLAAELEATADAGALNPDPIAVLVGLPTLLGRTLGGASYSIPVSVISGDPLSSLAARDRLYAVADAAADALSVSSYAPSSYTPAGNAAPVPSLELVSTVSLSRLPEVL